MSKIWIPDPIVHVDRKGGEERASDGYSRYGSYVGAREERFQDHWAKPEQKPLDPIYFANVAWEIATPPVMSPGLVDWRADLHKVTVGYDEEYGRDLMLTVELPLEHHQLAAKIPYTYQDWDRPYRSYEDGFQFLAQPGTRHDRPTLITMVTVRHILGSVTLVTPGKPTGRQLVDDALLSVEYTAATVNAELPEIIRNVQGEPR